jgi:hypothetical protein
LQYECIHTVTLALPFTKREDGSDSKNAPAVVKLCSDYLRVRTVRMIVLPILVFALILQLRLILILLLILIDTDSAIALYVTHPLHATMNNTAQPQSHSYVQCSNAYSCLEHPRNERLGTEIEISVHTVTRNVQGFIEDSDQNLKYLGLVGLVDLMKVFYLLLLLTYHDVILKNALVPCFNPVCNFLLWTHGSL